MEEAITNATVLILLSKIGRLNLLQIYNPILTTPQIRAEVLGKKEFPIKEKTDLEQYFSDNIKIESAVHNLDLDLGYGETSALSLCIEKKIRVFLSDDKKARKTAEVLSIKVIGTLGIILENIRQNKITKQEAKKILRLLLECSYYLSAETYAKIIDLIENKSCI